MVLLTGMVRRHQVLGPVLRPLDRPAAPDGQPGDEEVLRVELTPDAEPAARVDGVHVDECLVQAEHARQQVAVEHRDLGHAEDVEAAPPRSAGSIGSGDGQQAARLERHPGVPADRELDADHVPGGGEGGVGVAVAEGELGGGVLLVIGGAGRVGDGGLAVDVDVDQLGGVLTRVRVLADHHRERLTHVPDHVRGEHRLQVRAEIFAARHQADRDDQSRRKIPRGDDRGDARGFRGRGDIEPADLPVRRGGADDPGP